MISIAHADDHNLVRDAICNIIADFGEFEVEITADNGEDLINRLENASSLPDICILDIHMPVKNGYDTIKEIKRRWPSIKCLILSMYSDETVVMKMIKNGANGFLVKNCPIPELRTALKTIHETGYYYSELTTKFVHKSLNTLQPIINKRN